MLYYNFYCTIKINSTRLFITIKYFFVEMQSGTQLHIALLRKISHLMPIPNFRQRFNQSRKRKQLFRCNITEQSNCEAINQSHSILPLFDINSRRTPVANSKSKSKQALKEQNITISAWSIDEKDITQAQQETRYQTKLTKLTHDDSRKRHLSFNTNIQLKKVLPSIDNVRSPSQDQQRKFRTEKETPVRHKFSKIKQINLNINKENDLSTLQSILLRDKAMRPSIEKISSYNAFVSEMKTQQRMKKLRN